MLIAIFRADEAVPVSPMKACARSRLALGTAPEADSCCRR